MYEQFHSTVIKETSIAVMLWVNPVRPLNGTITVSKLELAAATIATQINKVVSKELGGRLVIDGVTY